MKNKTRKLLAVAGVLSAAGLLTLSTTALEPSEVTESEAVLECQVVSNTKAPPRFEPCTNERTL